MVKLNSRLNPQTFKQASLKLSPITCKFIVLSLELRKITSLLLDWFIIFSRNTLDKWNAILSCCTGKTKASHLSSASITVWRNNYAFYLMFLSSKDQWIICPDNSQNSCSSQTIIWTSNHLTTLKPEAFHNNNKLVFANTAERYPSTATCNINQNWVARYASQQIYQVISEG